MLSLSSMSAGLHTSDNCLFFVKIASLEQMCAADTFDWTCRKRSVTVVLPVHSVAVVIGTNPEVPSLALLRLTKAPTNH